MNGGYDDGYKSCSCFWGKQPGSLVKHLSQYIEDYSCVRVLDVGCGEGKNAAFFAQQGAKIDAFDVSQEAILNAKHAWADCESNITWGCFDIRHVELNVEKYDVVIGYGLLHCLSNYEEIKATVKKMQLATQIGGYHVICSFNDRLQDLSAHPNFNPTLINHNLYLHLYRNWDILNISDSDLKEEHPHNKIPHMHSMTRILARKMSASEKQG
jgi:cyclopropane fatty-acyl-phospholipid synthase-like methyltransferase